MGVSFVSLLIVPELYKFVFKNPQVLILNLSLKLISSSSWDLQADMKSIYPILSLSLRLIFLNIFFSKTLQDFMDWYQFYFLHDVCLEAISKFIAALWGWYYLLNRSWKQFHLPLKTSKWCIFDADNTFIWESLRHTFLVYLIFLTKLKLNKNSKKKRKNITEVSP